MADSKAKPKRQRQPSESGHTTTKVLLLSFESVDLYNLRSDMTLLRNGLLELDDSRHDLISWDAIDLRDSEKSMEGSLRAFLPPVGEVDEKTLYVIYYCGQALTNDDPDEGHEGLVFHSHDWKGNLNEEIHNRLWDDCRPEKPRHSFPYRLVEELQKYEPSSGVPRDRIRPLIMDAQCDTLVVLDRVNDHVTRPANQHLARALEDECKAYDGKFRKHLLGGCEIESFIHVLEVDLKKPGSSVRVGDIVEHINRRLGKWDIPLPPAFHSVLAHGKEGPLVLSQFWNRSDDSEEVMDSCDWL
ncbi:hypothetical protein QBC39DRAFT_343193 [Podospora conica]|nr:hypothetical protein QBC39DRAFT_343193 [Schizothecium conicum]